MEQRDYLERNLCDFYLAKLDVFDLEKFFRTWTEVIYVLPLRMHDLDCLQEAKLLDVHSVSRLHRLTVEHADNFHKHRNVPC